MLLTAYWKRVTLIMVKKVIVEVIRDWQDLDRQFKKGDWLEVYNTPGWNDFYYICSWGQILLSKEHCKIIKEIE